MDLINSVSMPEILVNIGFTDLYLELVNQLRMSIFIPAGIMTIIGCVLLLGLLFLTRISPKMKPQPGNSPVMHNSG
jgi:hypothetical protein